MNVALLIWRGNVVSFTPKDSISARMDRRYFNFWAPHLFSWRCTLNIVGQYVNLIAFAPEVTQHFGGIFGFTVDETQAFPNSLKNVAYCRATQFTCLLYSE